MQDNNPAASAARELKAAARDAMRVGSQWAHNALQWIDERSSEMNNRNREHEQRERNQRDRYSASGSGSRESEYGASQQYESQHYASRPSGQSGVLGGRQGRDRDIQAESGWRQPQHMGREGSYPQSSENFGSRGEYERGGSGSMYGSSGYEGGSQRNQYGQYAGSQGRSQEYAGAGRSSGYGAGRQEFDDQDFSQDYSQGSSHYGSQGFGAQGSQGVYGPQGFGAQGGIGARSSEYGLGPGYSNSGNYAGGSYGSGGYSREGYGGSQSAQGGSGQWRATDSTGQGYGGSTSYRGLGPKNYTRSDERIREDLNEKLTEAHDIDASGLSVEVNNGVATLTGSVDQRWMKHRAEDLAESCSGVSDVNNQIRVNASSGQQSGSQRSTYGSSANTASASGGSSSTRQAGASSGTSQSGTAQSSASTGSSTGTGTSSSAGTGNRPSGSSLS
ncbi:MAG TPA: BON domain-containing protein [Luteimonas sp.]|nr:BON domain-containing protein [Luteimonas sp.]